MKKTSATADERISRYLDLFASENKSIRDGIASILPVYNELLNMRARSFAEFALRTTAKQQGTYRDVGLINYENVLPPCPQCGDVENTVRKKLTGGLYYFCKSCSQTFTPNWRSISSDSKVSSLIYLKVLRCMLDFYSVDRTCAACNISPTTFYQIRNRLLYAMELIMREVKLFGLIQCDITYVRASYRGYDLDDGVPEDSIFDTPNYLPRNKKQRGGPNPNESKYTSAAAIFTAIDDHGHAFVRFIGLGKPTAAGISEAVGPDKILLTVPPSDPFPCANPKRVSQEALLPESPSLLVSDKESAIARFASMYGIENEAHIFSRKGKQMKLPPNAHNIQRVNALHHRLKAFLQRSNNVSTKYLPGFLTFFEWIEMTNATNEAIDQLFSVLATPGLGRSKAFFRERYVVPNYLTQLLKGESPLKKFSHKRLYAYFLYKQRKEKIAAGLPEEAMSTSHIAELTGYSETYIRRNYKNLFSSGYDPLISDYFKEVPSKKSGRIRKTFSPDRLALFDEYRACFSKESPHYITLQEFTKMVNERDGTSYNYKQLDMCFRSIVEAGLREATPRVRDPHSVHILTPREKRAIIIYEEYLNLIDTRIRTGALQKSKAEILEEFSKKYGRTAESMLAFFKIARKAQRLLKEWEAEGL